MLATTCVLLIVLLEVLRIWVRSGDVNLGQVPRVVAPALPRQDNARTRSRQPADELQTTSIQLQGNAKTASST